MLDDVLNRDISQVHCIKCLLAEYDQAAYERDVKKVLDLVDEDQKVTETRYAERLGVCKECDYLNKGTCAACGCFVELRAIMKKNRCPYKKW